MEWLPQKFWWKSACRLQAKFKNSVFIKTPLTCHVLSPRLLPGPVFGLCGWTSLFFNINFPSYLNPQPWPWVGAGTAQPSTGEANVMIVTWDRSIKGRPRAGDAAFNLIIAHFQAPEGAGSSACRKLKWGALSLRTHFDQRGYLQLGEPFSSLTGRMWSPKLFSASSNFVFCQNAVVKIMSLKMMLVTVSLPLPHSYLHCWQCLFHLNVLFSEMSAMTSPAD